MQSNCYRVSNTSANVSEFENKTNREHLQTYVHVYWQTNIALIVQGNNLQICIFISKKLLWFMASFAAAINLVLCFEIVYVYIFVA